MNSSGLLKIAGKIDTAKIDTLYRDLTKAAAHHNSPTYLYADWLPHCQQQLDSLFREFGSIDGRYSWFTANFDPTGRYFLHASEWHCDGRYSSGVVLSTAYPTQTEFKLPNGEIYIPEVGEVLEVNLSEVEHRSSTLGYYQPRLMIRVFLTG